MHAKRTAGASALQEHLMCAANLIQPYDPYQWVHPVASAKIEPLIMVFASEMIRRISEITGIGGTGDGGTVVGDEVKDDGEKVGGDVENVFLFSIH